MDNIATKLIGKKVFYRPLYEQHLKNSVISSFRQLENLKGENFTHLILDNGDHISLSECYFECPDDKEAVMDSVAVQQFQSEHPC